MARKVISITEDNSGSWKVGGEKSQPRSLGVCVKRVPRRYRLQRLFLWGCARQPRGWRVYQGQLATFRPGLIRTGIKGQPSEQETSNNISREFRGTVHCILRGAQVQLWGIAQTQTQTFYHRTVNRVFASEQQNLKYARLIETVEKITI